MFNDSKKFQKTFEKVEKDLLSKYSDFIEEIWVYGSCANDKNNRKSDINLLVVYNKDRINSIFNPCYVLEDIVYGCNVYRIPVNVEVASYNASDSDNMIKANIGSRRLRRNIESNCALVYQRLKKYQH